MISIGAKRALEFFFYFCFRKLKCLTFVLGVTHHVRNNTWVCQTLVFPKILGISILKINNVVLNFLGNREYFSYSGVADKPLDTKSIGN